MLDTLKKDIIIITVRINSKMYTHIEDHINI